MLFDDILPNHPEVSKKYAHDFPIMADFASLFKKNATVETLGREKEIKRCLSNLARPELNNIGLIADPGVGKTQLVEGLAQYDTSRFYFELDLSRMAIGSANTAGSIAMATRMKDFVEEIKRFQRKVNRECVIFMDEFHQVAMDSPAALEALKPLFARSGRYGIRFIVATTYREFNKYILGNGALTERLQLIRLDELSKEVTLKILKSRVKQSTPDAIVDNSIYQEIIDVTSKYLPAEKQPRKSVRILDAMQGKYNAFHMHLNHKTLVLVVKEMLGINLEFKADIPHLAENLSKRVFDQEYAVEAIVDRLYLSETKLYDTTRPLGSFLFTGPTGVGKTEMAKAMAEQMLGDESQMIRFDMSEYSDPRTTNRFQHQLALAVWEHPSSIILLDEIEKSNSDVTHLLLQVLDDGRLTDQYHRPISFKNTYIIMTTNGAQEVYKSFQEQNGEAVAKATTKGPNATTRSELYGKGSTEALNTYINLIRDALMNMPVFPPELLGRIDAVVPFKPLNRDTKVKIAKAYLAKLRDKIITIHHKKIDFSNDVVRFIVDEHSNIATNAGGGREIQQEIDHFVSSKVAEFLIMHPNVNHLSVEILGKMYVDHKDMLHGNAYVEVGKYATH